MADEPETLDDPLEKDVVTPPAGQAKARRPDRGIRPSAKRVFAHMSSLAQLERELARSELKRKGATAGAGAGVAVAAGILTLFAIGFGLAAAAAALALVVDWWLSLLIVFVALVLLVFVLVLVSRRLFERGTPLKPEQAVEEARITKQVLRDTIAG